MTTTEMIPQTAQKQYELIRGDFEPDDAREILGHLVGKKVNFHQTRNFSSLIRFGHEDAHSLQRIEELENTFSELKAIIRQAAEQGTKLRISAQISVETV